MESNPPIQPIIYPTVSPRQADDTFDVQSNGENIAKVGQDAEELADYIDQWEWYNRNIKAGDELYKLLERALRELEAQELDTSDIRAALDDLKKRCDFPIR